MAEKRRNNTNLILLGALILVLFLGFLINNWQAVGLSGGVVLVLLVIIKILPDLIDKPIKHRIKEEHRADRGADAEVVIGEILDDLDNNYFVLNDIPSPYGNIDHIVIGKNSGVFLLETKSHFGQVEVYEKGILVNGEPPEKNFISQVLKNTYWLRDEIEAFIGIKVWITPVIVFTNAFVVPGRPIKGVRIINKKFLLEILERPSKPNASLVALWQEKESLAEQLDAI